MKRLLLSVLFFAISGCASIPPEKATAISGIDDDQFSKVVTIRGARLYENPFGGMSKVWMLRSWVNKTTGAASHQLYVALGYIGSWKFFNSAADDTAKTLPLTVISRDVNGLCSASGCSLDETFGIDIDEAVLKQRAQSGYPVKVQAQNGESLIMVVTPEQIQLQTAAVDKVVAGLPHAPAAAQAASPAAAPPVLGLNFVDLPPSIAAAIRHPELKAVLVVTVTPNSAAEKSGIRTGDVIYRYDGKPIASPADLQKAVAATPAGKVVQINAYRGEKDLPFTVHL